MKEQYFFIAGDDYQKKGKTQKIKRKKKRDQIEVQKLVVHSEFIKDLEIWNSNGKRQ